MSSEMLMVCSVSRTARLPGAGAAAGDVDNAGGLGRDDYAPLRQEQMQKNRGGELGVVIILTNQWIRDQV